MLYDTEIQGHDSHLEGVAVDVLNRTVTLRLTAYPEAGASERVPIEMVFTEVERVHTSANLSELAKHHFAGT